MLTELIDTQYPFLYHVSQSRALFHNMAVDGMKVFGKCRFYRVESLVQEICVCGTWHEFQVETSGGSRSLMKSGHTPFTIL